MKVWLNNLKEGAIFYHILLDSVHKCKHLGDAHNMNFRMPRIKFKVLDGDALFNENLLGDIHEAFVNQYVYDTKEDALEVLIEQLNQKIRDAKFEIERHKLDICNLENDIKLIQNKLKKYDKHNIEKN